MVAPLVNMVAAFWVLLPLRSPNLSLVLVLALVFPFVAIFKSPLCMRWYSLTDVNIYLITKMSERLIIKKLY